MIIHIKMCVGFLILCFFHFVGMINISKQKNRPMILIGEYIMYILCI